MSLVEKVARAITAVGPPESFRGSFEAWEIAIARAAIEAMREYSEEMSQAGGAIGKYGLIPIAANNPPIGQGIAERCYLAMIDAALK